MPNTDQEKILASLLPSVSIDCVTLETSTERLFKRTKVNLDVSICQFLKDDILTGWFSEEQIKRYLKIKVVESSTSESTQLISDESGVLFDVSSRDGLRENVFSINSILSAGSAASDAYLARSSMSRSESGGDKYEFSFRTSFTTDRKPRHLTYYAMCYLDMNELSEDFGISYDPSILNVGPNNIFRQSVFDAGVLVSQQLAEDGETLISNYRVHDHRLFSRGIGDLTLRPLAAEEIVGASDVKSALVKEQLKRGYLDSDSYISDMYISRSTDGSSRFLFSLDLSKFIETKSNLGALYKNSDEKTKKEIISLCSVRNMTLSRKRVKYSQKTTKLGTVVREPVAYNGASELTQEAPLVRASGTKISAESSLASIREVSLAMNNGAQQLQNRKILFFTGKDKEMKDLTDGLYQYTIIADIEDGTTKYLSSLKSQMKESRKRLETYLGLALQPNKTKMVLNDPHIDFAGESAAYKSGETSEKIDIVSGVFTSAFESEVLSKYEDPKQYPWIECVSQYIHSLSVLYNISEDEDSIEELSRKIMRMVSPASGTIMGLESFIKLYDSLMDALDKSFVDGNEATHGSEKSNASRRVSNNLLSIRKDFKDNIYDSNINKFNGYDYLSNWPFEKVGSKSRREMLSEDSSFGLKVLSSNTWQDRVDNENKKWFTNFKTEESGTDEVSELLSERTPTLNDYSYLSPSAILYGDRKILENTLSPDKPMEEYTSVIPHIILDSPATMEDSLVPAPPSPPSAPVPDDDLYYISGEKLLAFQNVTMMSELEFKMETEMEIATEPPESGMTLVTTLATADINTINKPDREVEIVTPTSCVVKKRTPAESEEVEQRNTIVSNIAIPLSRSVVKLTTTKISSKVEEPTKKLTLKTEAVRKISSGESQKVLASLKSSDVISLPNQFVRVLASSEKNYETSPIDASVYDLNINLLNMVEYFDGYSVVSTMSGRSVKTPIWKKLTREDFSSLRGRHILCRTVKYSNNKVGISRSPNMDLPVYDEYFFIECPNKLSSSRLASIKQVAVSTLGQEWENILFSKEASSTVAY
jgi:hypothetical protein